jgi:hypothetical protein
MVSLSLQQIKHTSAYLAVSTNRSFGIGQRRINSFFMVHVWLVCSGKLWSQMPVFLWRKRWACCYSHVSLSHHRTEYSTILFKQDGATARTARVSMEVIWEMFLEHVITLCLPCIFVCHYFLCECLKVTTRPWIIDDLKIATQKQISATRKHGKVSIGKPADRVGRVFTQWWATF